MLKRDERVCAMRRGSVMMEFIIVFPIYLVLWGATFAIGDMLIHSNRLTSADRIAAFEAAFTASGRVDTLARGNVSGVWNFVTGLLFRPLGLTEIADDRTAQDALSYAGTTAVHYAHDNAPWTMCVATTARDDYKLMGGGTLGQLLFADWYLSDATGTDQADANSPLGDWRAGRRTAMSSKESVADALGGNRYSYYTLRRRRWTGASWHECAEYDSDGYLGQSTLIRQASALMRDNHWYYDLVNEKWHTDSSVLGGGSSFTPCSPRRLSDYLRYDSFVTWSR